MKLNIMDGNHSALISIEKMNSVAKLAIPSPDHYLPLLYVLGLQNKNESIKIFNDVLQMDSI